MKVFLTGANGFIGSRLVTTLLAAGHDVLGLTRSDAGALRLRASGAEPCHGTIEDIDGLKEGAARCDAVIHTAFDHDFSRYVENCRKDERSIRALCEAYESTRKPMVITSTTLFGEPVPGALADEDVFNPEHANPRVISESAIQDGLARGCNISVVRLAQIHDTHKQGLVTFLIDLARRTGVSAYVGEGVNRWCAAHLDDTANLYRLALEEASAGARYHASAEEGVTLREIAEAIGRKLDLPVKQLTDQEAPSHFGWLVPFVAKNMIASSAKTRSRLLWQPEGPTLLEDLRDLASA